MEWQHAWAGVRWETTERGRVLVGYECLCPLDVSDRLLLGKASVLKKSFIRD